MTENEFLQPENRWGCAISAERKRVWNKQIHLLKAFDAVCKKHGLKYYAFGGTLLGAIRHKGFIPWDDDIDLAMPRDDYDRLLSLPPSTFETPVFLQNVYTDQIKRGHCELRDVSTTCLMDCDFDAPYNTGVFIDIFALDYVDKDSLPNDLERMRNVYRSIPDVPKKILGNSRPVLAKIYNSICVPVRKVAYKVFGLSKKRVKKYSIFEQECKRYNHKTSYLFLMEFAASLEKYGGAVYDANLFDDIVYKEFEYVLIPCPKNYDAVLTKRYGDYMSPKRGGALHNDLFFDLENSSDYYRKIIRTPEQFKRLFETNKEK